MTRDEKEHTGKYILEMAKLLEDGCYQQEQLLNAVRIIDESLEQERAVKETKMTNHEKFIEIFGETNGAVKASEEWLEKEYAGPVTMTEREKFLDWLDEQPLVRYEEYDSTGDAIYIYGTNDDQPLLRVSGFDKVPGKVYVRIDGLCGDKPLSYVKDIVRTASNKGIDKVFGLDGLYDSIFGR